MSGGGPSPGILAAGAIGGVMLVLAAVGAPISRRPAPPPAPLAAPPPSVAAGGITLTSASISLPDEAETLPAGPNVDLVTARCTACHSAAMILTQPPLSRDQWQATLTKMREVYHAPLTAADDPALLAYLTAPDRVKAP